MKIGMITQWFDPEPGPASLPGVYAREFVKQGHTVRVLTGFPNYPDGELYSGYSIKPRADEGGSPLEIRRVALYPSHNSSALGRALNYLSFGFSASVFGGRFLKDVDAIWVYNSPITVMLPMLWHSKFGKKPVFLHVQDLWPDSLLESGMISEGKINRIISSMVKALVRLMERKSSVIGVISESVESIILQRNPNVDSSKIVYVPNPTNEELFKPNTRDFESESSNENSVLEVMYAGAIGEVQGLTTLVQAAALLKHRTDIRFTIVGDGIRKQSLEQEARELGVSNITFTGRVPQHEVPKLIDSADIQIVSLASNKFLSYTTPSKIPTLLASGVPVLAQLEGDGASLLERSGAAIVVEPGNPVEFAEQLEYLADLEPWERKEMGDAGRKFYEEHLSASSAALKIINALKSKNRG